MNYYYIDNNNQQQGPFSGAVIRDLAQRGIITPQTILVTDTGIRVPASSAKGLVFGSVSPASTPTVNSTPVDLAKTPPSAPAQTPINAVSQPPHHGPTPVVAPAPVMPVDNTTYFQPQPGVVPSVPVSPFDGMNSPFSSANPPYGVGTPDPQVYGIHPQSTAQGNPGFGPPQPGPNPVGNPAVNREKEYKVVAGPKIIQVDMGRSDHAFDTYTKIINDEAVHGWTFHSVENITVEEDKGCAGAVIQLLSTFAPFLVGAGNNTRTNYYMLIFERDR